MSQKELVDIIRKELYTRKIDILTGKPVVDNDLEKEFRKVILENNKRILTTVSNSDSQYFHVINHVQGNITTLTENANMVSCLFPKKLIISSFIRQGSFKYLLAGIYERFKLLLENDIIDLYVITDEYDMDWKPNRDNEQPEILCSDSIHLLTQSYDMLNYDGYIKINLPWLINARQEDYIELISKYNLQFENYSRQIDKITKIAKNPDELSNLFVREVQDAFIDIRISLEKSQSELFKKGIKTAIGTVATAIPFLLPLENSYISSELLASILGATNIISTIPPIIDSGFDIKNTGRENPYWLLWKWNNIKKQSTSNAGSAK